MALSTHTKYPNKGCWFAHLLLFDYFGNYFELKSVLQHGHVISPVNVVLGVSFFRLKVHWQTAKIGKKLK